MSKTNSAFDALSYKVAGTEVISSGSSISAVGATLTSSISAVGATFTSNVSVGRMTLSSGLVNPVETGSTSATLSSLGVTTLSTSVASPIKVMTLGAPILGGAKTLFALSLAGTSAAVHVTLSTATFDGTNKNAIFSQSGSFLNLIGGSGRYYVVGYGVATPGATSNNVEFSNT